MIDYQKRYALMVHAAEAAICELEKQNYGTAKEVLIAAENEAEELYIQAESK